MTLNIDVMLMLVRQESCAKQPSHKLISSSKFQEEGQGQKDDFEFRVSSFKERGSAERRLQVPSFKFQVSKEEVRKDYFKFHVSSFKGEGRGEEGGRGGGGEIISSFKGREGFKFPGRGQTSDSNNTPRK